MGPYVVVRICVLPKFNVVSLILVTSVRYLLADTGKRTAAPFELVGPLFLQQQQRFPFPICFDPPLGLQLQQQPSPFARTSASLPPNTQSSWCSTELRRNADSSVAGLAPMCL